MASQNNLCSTILNRTSFIQCCYFSESSHYVLPSYTVVFGFLICPLYFLVLHTGFQRWRKNKRSTVSHTDFFTYHNVLFEFLFFCAFCAISCASNLFDEHLLELGVKIMIFNSPGLLSHHTLTCAERYLAVVYPVVYLSLKKKQWIWARNVVLFVIWVFCILFTFVTHILGHQGIPSLCVLGIVTCIIIFCNVHALHTLRNPSPGERGRVSKSKRKAFYTMFAILSTLLLWFTFGIVFHGVDKADLLDPEMLCKFLLSAGVFQFPSSLVLPLLFLHRAGKVPTCGKRVDNPG